MFKKIEIWILYFTILLSIPITIGFGVLVRQELIGSSKLGKISRAALFLSEIPKNLSYIINNSFEGESPDLQMEDRFPLLKNFNGTPNSQDSFLLLSKYDGDLQEGLVELINLSNFETLHVWNPDTDKFNKLIEKVDDFKYLNRDSNNSRAIPEIPKLLKNGSLIFLQGHIFRKIDKCSRLISQNSHDQFHHSIETDFNGNIWVPSHMFPQTLPIEKVGRYIKDEGGYMDDTIVKLSPKGDILFEKSVSQIFLDNGLEYLLFAHGEDYEEDPIHLNDIQPVNFDGDFWKKGDVFLSLRNQSMIILFRPSTNQIIWKGTGPFLRQHDVNILDKNRISIFNNRSINVFKDINIIDGNNEVLVYNFKKDKYISYLKDSLFKNDVRTITGGRSKILPNGDLLVEETNSSKILYFNADGSLRWTYLNRAENGNVYAVGWSRILYNQEDVLTVKEFLKSTVKCND